MNIIRSGELKLHLTDSAKKLGFTIMPILINTDSNGIIANTPSFVRIILVNTSAIEKMEKKEQFAILDHELGHIKWWKKLLIFLLYFISPFTVILLPIPKMWPYAIPFLILFVIFRFSKLGYIVNIKYNAELMADKTSAELGNSEAMISILRRTENYNQEQTFPRIKNFIYWFNWFYFSNRSSHPSISERIKNLEEISTKAKL